MGTIWYMGAKTRLTAEIEAALERAAPRAEGVLDLMSGTSAVSQALAQRYRVVANDVQAYASLIARAYLELPAERAAFLAGLDPERDLGPAFRRNQAALLEWLAPAVALEDAYLEAFGLTPDATDPEGGELLAGPGVASERRAARRRLGAEADDPGALAAAYRAFALQHTPAFLEERDAPARGAFAGARELYRRATVRARREEPALFPYLLASAYYPNVYLGLRQAVAVDSLRYAIDALPRRGRYARARRTHYLAALLHAMSVTTSATSHFCQPRGLTRAAEVKAVLLRRAQSIPSKLAAYSRAIQAGVEELPARSDHRAVQHPWRELYARWDELPQVDAVYADPPYTADNYSRFYHVLEVVTHYDYPPLETRRGQTTKGRYPAIARRHQSPFCRRGQVEDELRSLCQSTAARGAALVLSYGEENGLLLKLHRQRGDTPAAALRRFAGLAEGAYREVELIKKPLLHSGQGDSNHTVTELLLVGRRPLSARARARRGA